MDMKKSALATAMGLVLGGASMSTGAALTTSVVLNFTTGSGPSTGTPPASGSWFSMLAADTDGDSYADANEYTPISQNNGIHIGTVQSASGSHGSFPGCDPGATKCTGAGGPGENPNIDNPWSFFGATGMHQTTSAITEVGSTANGFMKTLDFSGWNVTWNGIASIPMGGDTANFAADTGLATITCSIASCSVSSTFTLDYSGHTECDGTVGGSCGVLYSLHLEGQVSAVPVPAAIWLFGSGLLGLVGMARRKKVI